MVRPSQKTRHLGLQGFQRILGLLRRLRGRGRGLFGGFGRRSGWATRRLNVRLWLLRRLRRLGGRGGRLLRRRRIPPRGGRRDFLRARQEGRGRRARRGGAGREDWPSRAGGWPGGRRVRRRRLAGGGLRPGLRRIEEIRRQRARRLRRRSSGRARRRAAWLFFPALLLSPRGFRESWRRLRARRLLRAWRLLGAKRLLDLRRLFRARGRFARRLWPLRREFVLDWLLRRFSGSWRRLFGRRRSWGRWPAGGRGPRLEPGFARVRSGDGRLAAVDPAFDKQVVRPADEQ
jgi:hypothetical protein